MRRWMALIIALGLAACGSQQPAGKNPENERKVGTQPNRARPLKEFMGHVVQRNAEQMWTWSEQISDANGVRSLAPKSETDWLNAESDAMTMVELAIVIESSAYKIDDKWPQFSGQFLRVATDVAKAAEEKSFNKFSSASDAMNDACVACHLHYVPELEGASPAPAHQINLKR